jgi:hypothetical protein
MTPTNHRVEIRTCIKCGETKEIPQKQKHATNTCIECQRTYSKEYQRAEAIREGRRVGTTGRVPYPLEERYTTTGNKFKLMASKTFRIRDKSEWRQLMRERLDAALNNVDLMKWINAHDGDEPIKKQKKIERDYPDTRGITWDEYERGLGEDEVDS